MMTLKNMRELRMHVLLRLLPQRRPSAPALMDVSSSTAETELPW